MIEPLNFSRESCIVVSLRSQLLIEPPIVRNQANIGLNQSHQLCLIVSKKTLE